MKVEIKKENLVISIPLKHMKYGIENHPMDPKKVNNLQAMAQYYKRALIDETVHDGQMTLFEELLDKISVLAIENGEEWIEWDEEYR